MPGRLASIVSVFGWPGTTSFLPASAGTQNEWITFLLVSVSTTGWCTGMCISLAVKNCAPLSVYSYCQNHWRASTFTWMTFGPFGILARLKMVATVGTAITARIRNGMIVQLTSRTMFPWV